MIDAGSRSWLDAAGVVVSVTCGVHCAASGVFLSVLALAGIAESDVAWLEWGFVSTTAVIGGWALRAGWRRHRRSAPSVLFLAGLTGLLIARWLGEAAGVWEVGWIVAGAAAISVAHVVNARAAGCPSVTAPYAEPLT